MRASAARVALPALALLGLAAVVVVAAGGSTPAGSGASRPVPDVLLDSLISVGLLLLLPAAAMLVYGLAQRRAISAEIQRRKYPRFGLVAWTVFVLLLALLTWYRGRSLEPPLVEDELGEQSFPGSGAPPGTEAPSTTVYEPELAWLPVLALVLLALVGVVALFLAARRAAPDTRSDTALAPSVAGILADTLDDLRGEADPRRAIIAAFARLERAFAASGLPRRRAETAREYTGRALRELDVPARSATRLAALFEVAKFSHHAVGAGMKEEAIAALEDVRDRLLEATETDEHPPRPEASPA